MSELQDQHEQIAKGGEVEEFGRALGAFCRAEGWTKLQGEDGLSFPTLRHYLSADKPYGAGYEGKAGIKKVMAYLSFDTEIKEFIEYCLGDSLGKWSRDEGKTPHTASKEEWDDVTSAKVAKEIEDNPEGAYATRAAPFVDGAERRPAVVKEKDEFAAISLTYRHNKPYDFANKVVKKLPAEVITIISEALTDKDIADKLEYEGHFVSAWNTLRKTNSKNGWGKEKIKAPKDLRDRTPTPQDSRWVDGERGSDRLMELGDSEGVIATVRLSKTGGGAQGINFGAYTASSDAGENSENYAD